MTAHNVRVLPAWKMDARTLFQAVCVGCGYRSSPLPRKAAGQAAYQHKQAKEASGR